MNQWTAITGPGPFRLLIAATPRGLLRVWLTGDRARFESELHRLTPGENWREASWQAGREAPPSGLLADAARQFNEYFDGRRTSFDLRLDMRGTPFQVRVWKALLEIPFGETCSYGQLAARIGAPKAVRAVGAANGRNQLPIVVPCHRVIGADGSLHGFTGGLHLKQALLDLEGRRAQPPLFTMQARA
jgi:methylated-DNA-[protein]-cysteine S-methyltransferase